MSIGSNNISVQQPLEWSLLHIRSISEEAIVVCDVIIMHQGKKRCSVLVLISSNQSWSAFRPKINEEVIFEKPFGSF